MQQIDKFFALTFQLRILLCKAFIILGLVRMGLWLIPFRQLSPWIQWLITQISQPEASGVISVNQVVWAIETATHYFPKKPKCLARALTTQILLHHYGYSCELRFGVAKSESNGFIAHAWIERDGQVLIGGDFNLSSLTLLPSLD